jgi:hypothetical protein
MGSETSSVHDVRILPVKGRGIWPALGLVFVAPLVAEFLLGNLPIKLLPALIVLAPMYGGGALLIREVVRRTGRGWPSILLLGMAYGIFEEAFTTQSLFNPNYLKLNLGLLTPAYIPSLGIGAWWTLWMLMVHGIWSISTPIALVAGARGVGRGCDCVFVWCGVDDGDWVQAGSLPGVDDAIHRVYGGRRVAVSAGIHRSDSAWT